MKYIASQTLGPVTEEDIKDIELGLCLSFPSNEDEEEQIWTHKMREEGGPCFPPKQVSESEIN